ncbi:unnamed protein product [Darwinula stevensoni]|uniref:Uncharacterized protein n=1 Tax=Darwinula stevensoni TaxID=69355 RepID=A0A7R9A5S7_9CRUS|nr:unnamed protein product [Darwinula stevensoni]CAG0892636.1 unnamed protein product [Darwinula stevensoni]
MDNLGGFGRSLNRKSNSLEQEKEEFEKQQAQSIQKAINSQETPVKAKHARTQKVDHEEGWSVDQIMAGRNLENNGTIEDVVIVYCSKIDKSREQRPERYISRNRFGSELVSPLGRFLEVDEVLAEKKEEKTRRFNKATATQKERGSGRDESMITMRKVAAKMSAFTVTSSCGEKATLKLSATVKSSLRRPDHYLIIGTFQEKGASRFWLLAQKQPIIGNPVVAWKFCHVLHKLLRDGHHNVVPQSIRYCSLLVELGRMWGHLREGYGNLILRYSNLLITKLKFHENYPGFPGNVHVTDDQLEVIGGNDINNYFQLAVEMFDYMDDILALQLSVFGSLDMSRSNSMTSAGQCRLAPLIPCILDSSHLYDYTVKILFKLHASLPSDVLVGHRERFYKAFPVLRKFYLDASILQYFKNLIQVPLLPPSPPNFMIAADLKNYVTPVARLEEDVPDEPELEVGNLIDTSASFVETPPAPPPVPALNGVLAEKDRLLSSLHREIEELREELLRVRNEYQRVIANLSRENQDLKVKLGGEEGMRRDLAREVKEYQERLAALQQEKEREALSESSRVKVAEERYVKMKDVYGKLREEHIALLRGKADLERKIVEKEEISNQTNSLQALVECLEREKGILERQKREDDETFHKTRAKELLQLFGLCETMVNGALKDKEMTLVPSWHPESLPHLVEPARLSLESSLQSLVVFKDEKKSYPFVKDILLTCHLLAYVIVTSFSAAHQSPNIEKGDHLSQLSQGIGDEMLHLITSLKNSANKEELRQRMEQVRRMLLMIGQVAEELLMEVRTSQSDVVGDQLQDELASMDRLIEEAALRIQEMLREREGRDSGIKLEVNSKILESCTGLMQAIRLLVKKARVLQEEIVAQGKGGASAKEFYKRNHRWTEGLLSAAKAVGLGAKFLLDAADRVVEGNGKFEEVMAASQEIAASTAQLVVASRVKAQRGSSNLQQLSSASKDVSRATGHVVATAKGCLQMIEESEEFDMGKLSLHQTKRLEMECQVKVLELETSLSRERVRLASLRKHHYALAGEVEASDVERDMEVEEEVEPCTYRTLDPIGNLLIRVRLWKVGLSGFPLEGRGEKGLLKAKVKAKARLKHRASGAAMSDSQPEDARLFRWQEKVMSKGKKIPRENIVECQRISKGSRKKQKIERMCILADLASFDLPPCEHEDYEIVLVELRYYPEERLLWMKPDFSRGGGVYAVPQGTSLFLPSKFLYRVECASPPYPDALALRQAKAFAHLFAGREAALRQFIGEEFESPSPKHLRLHVDGEILAFVPSLGGSNLSVHAMLVLPTAWRSEGGGKKAVTTAACRVNGGGAAHYAHPFEWDLFCPCEADAVEFVLRDDDPETVALRHRTPRVSARSLSPSLQLSTRRSSRKCCRIRTDEGEPGSLQPSLCFEVTSWDAWGRGMPIGYGALPLPSAPGFHLLRLQTWKPVPIGRKALMREYFLGAEPRVAALEYAAPRAVEGKSPYVEALPRQKATENGRLTFPSTARGAAYSSAATLGSAPRKYSLISAFRPIGTGFHVCRRRRWKPGAEGRGVCYNKAIGQRVESMQSRYGFQTIGSGRLDLRLSVSHQLCIGDGSSVPRAHESQSFSVSLGTVLEAFHRARQRLSRIREEVKVQ